MACEMGCALHQRPLFRRMHTREKYKAFSGVSTMQSRLWTRYAASGSVVSVQHVFLHRPSMYSRLYAPTSTVRVRRSAITTRD
jgi:hypothetical protein